VSQSALAAERRRATRDINTPIKAYCHLDRSSTKATVDVIGKMLHLKSTLALDNSGKSDKRTY
jgi:hypothetical protein